MNPENFEDFLRELPEFLREKFGADAKIVMGAVNLRSRKPVAVRDGFVGRVRWEIRLMPDDSPSHEIFVELPKRVHPRLHGKIGELLESYQPQDAHTCAEGPREWHKALHLTVAQDTACEEVAASLAKVIDQCRISRVQQAWVKFRVWLAARILPAGLEIS